MECLSSYNKVQFSARHFLWRTFGGQNVGRGGEFGAPQFFSTDFRRTKNGGESGEWRRFKGLTERIDKHSFCVFIAVCVG